LLCVLILLLCGCGDGVARVERSESLPPLSVPITNNAVVTVETGDRVFIVSFNGLGEGRSHSDTTSSTYVFDGSTQEWHEASSVPGGDGRLASVAAAAGSRAYVFGGYTVAQDGTEISTPWVHAFDPATGDYEQRSPMPVPVDDVVAVTHQDRFIYLISGWHDLGNVNLVQRYDTETNTWAQATPIPGPAVFGHAGGIVNNSIVYCDGVAIEPHADRRRDFAAVDNCYLGLIDKKDGRRVDWRIVTPHPGLPRYRMAAAGVAAANAILFIGGSENPYNYDGIGYDGTPSQPAPGALLFDLETMTWRAVDLKGQPTMDHRGLVNLGDRWLTIGGMTEDQLVTDTVNAYRIK
jgi:hypothetical protein